MPIVVVYCLGGGLNADSNWAECRILLCPLAMLRLHVLNRSKIAQCEREGITAEKSETFAELGDGSPLYRFVPYSIEVPTLH